MIEIVIRLLNMLRVFLSKFYGHDVKFVLFMTRSDLVVRNYFILQMIVTLVSWNSLGVVFLMVGF